MIGRLLTECERRGGAANEPLPDVAAELVRQQRLTGVLLHVIRIDAAELFREYVRREFRADTPLDLTPRELDRLADEVMRWTSPIG